MLLTKNNTRAHTHIVLPINKPNGTLCAAKQRKSLYYDILVRSRFSWTGRIENRRILDSTHARQFAIMGRSPRSSKRFMRPVHVSQWSINFLIELEVDVPLPRHFTRSNRFSDVPIWRYCCARKQRGASLQGNTRKLLKLKLFS